MLRRHYPSELNVQFHQSLQSHQFEFEFCFTSASSLLLFFILFACIFLSFIHSAHPSIPSNRSCSVSPFFLLTFAHSHFYYSYCCCCFQRCVLFYFLGYTFYSYNFAFPSYFNLSPYLLLGCVHLLYMCECVRDTQIYTFVREIEIIFAAWLAQARCVFFHLYSYHENL